MSVCKSNLLRPVLQAYCHLWPLWLDHIFLHYLKYGTIFGNKVGSKLCVLIFSTTVSDKFLSLRKIQRDIVINVHRSSCQEPVNFVRF